ncbi:MAG: 3-phosphoshikimate 1-carboxyvinyltransferase [Bacteroidetes bacterium]|nr:3-phosphoshikimate 1-carboxyvinyltransferase [Bacteroidota bacterium]
MEVTIRKGRVEGKVHVPSSKSLLQRYLIGALLAEGVTELYDVHHCNDTLACLDAVQSFQSQSQIGSGLRIEGGNGVIYPSIDRINCGESGFALRALASVAALAAGQITLTGSGSLQRRPVSFFENVFPELGVECKTNGGFLPLNVRGPMRFKDISIDGSLSSQFLSGLLIVYPLANKDHVIDVKNLSSKHYIDLTLQVMKDFGVNVTHESYQKFFIPGNQKYKSCKAVIEGDWSAASFLLVAGATAGEVTVNNLSMNSLQPDKAIVEVLRSCGAEVTLNNNSVSVTSSDFKLRTSNFKSRGFTHDREQASRLQTHNLKPFKFDSTDCPDLFPPLVALAARCNGISEITGVQRLIHKESNRALALQQEFSKMNDKLISIEGNKMIICGGLPLKSANVDSHNDHRIAMSLAIAGLNVEGGIQISGCESVQKSYPDFFANLEKLIMN